MQPQHRLRASDDFVRAQRRGRSWGNALLVLHAFRTGDAPARCGFAVSRRVGNAVVRNRVRRRLREIARQRLAGVGPGWDVVLTARPAVAGAPFAEVTRAVDELLRRARLLPPLAEGQTSGEAVGEGALRVGEGGAT